MTLRQAQGGPLREAQGARDCDVQASGAIELYFYGELTLAGRDEVERHVSGCAHCRQSLQELAEIRAALASRPVVSAPPAGDWSAFMARLEAAIEDDAPASVAPCARPARVTGAYAGYLAMAALLALVTISVLFAARSRFVAPTTPSTSRSADITPLPVKDDTGMTALASLSQQHFERSKLVVLGLAAKDAQRASGADWAYERKLATNLLSDTRLYRMVAEERGMRTVAGVMRDLELVLLQASLSDEADTATLAQIQRLIRKRDLLEKMNVVTTRGL